MATIDSLIHDILAPVEAVAHLAPKVLGWLDADAQADAGPTWDWFATGPAAGGSSSTAVEVVEFAMPLDMMASLFGLSKAPAGLAH